MYIVTRTSKTPATAIDVRINVERTAPQSETPQIDQVCRTFAPGDEHTLEDDVVDRLRADPGLAKHFAYTRVEAEGAAAPATTKKPRA